MVQVRPFTQRRPTTIEIEGHLRVHLIRVEYVLALPRLVEAVEGGIILKVLKTYTFHSFITKKSQVFLRG